MHGCRSLPAPTPSESFPTSWIRNAGKSDHGFPLAQTFMAGVWPPRQHERVRYRGEAALPGCAGLCLPVVDKGPAIVYLFGRQQHRQSPAAGGRPAMVDAGKMPAHPAGRAARRYLHGKRSWPGLGHPQQHEEALRHGEAFPGCASLWPVFVRQRAGRTLTQEAASCAHLHGKNDGAGASHVASARARVRCESPFGASRLGPDRARRTCASGNPFRPTTPRA